LAPQAFQDTDHKLNIRVWAYYPHLDGIDDKTENHFNRHVDALVMDQIDRIKGSVSGLPTPEPRGTIHIDYQVTYHSPDLVSILFEVGTYAGGAHPSDHSATFNYDLRTRQVLDLEDLFKRRSNPLSTIASYCANDLDRREVLFFHDGVLPEPENYASWNVSADALTINFDAYQVAAYAYGPQRVHIPYAVLSEIIDPEGPLSGFQ
jgi:hypothetical protein